MPDDAADPRISLPLFQAYHPSTFMERGVAVPFTTPALAGARARPAERGGTEILVPNPSGARGLYILPWSGICQLCRPTVHDVMLNRRVDLLPSVTPEVINRVARALAAEGLAGREASAAALAAGEAERTERLVANFHLLLALTEQLVPSELGTVSGVQQNKEDLKARARRAASSVGPKIGLTPEAVADALEQLAEVFVGLGVRGQHPPPRLPRLVDAVRGLRDAMIEWRKSHGGDDATAAEMIAAVAEMTLACAERTISDAQSLVQDMAELLRLWRERREEIAQLAARPAWLLDGWERICLLWAQASSPTARGAAVFRMALLVPILPREVSDWMGAPIDTELVWRFHRTVRRNEDWRTGALLDLIAANERLRALAI